MGSWETTAAGVGAGHGVRVSILLPVRNRARTIVREVAGVLEDAAPDVPVDLVVLDDGSDDSTALELVLVGDPRLTVHRHHEPRGMGAALRTAAERAPGTHVLPLGPGHRLAPGDLARLVEPVTARRGSVVFGVRPRRRLDTWARSARIRARLAAALDDVRLVELRPSLKLIPRALFLSLPPAGFDTRADADISTALLRRDIQPLEVRLQAMEMEGHGDGRRRSTRRVRPRRRRGR